MKNQYEYLTNTHDLKSLSDWGPFARDIYALSHITDRERGLKFDFFFVPGILRRNFFMPETLRECGCSPMEAAPDLSYFSFRQQMEGQDHFYCDSTYVNIGKDLWLGRCNFVNNTHEQRGAALLAYSRMAPRQDVMPQLVENAYFVDALEYESLQYAYKRFDENLVFANGKHGEQYFPGTVGGRCLGRPPYHRQLPCFAAKTGDTVAYKFDTDGGKEVILVRLNVENGEKAAFKCTVNGSEKIFEIQGTGKFELIELYRGKLPAETSLSITSTADCSGIRFDGFVIGKNSLTVNNTTFAPIGRAVAPQIKTDHANNINIISSPELKNSYCVWWSMTASAVRKYWQESLAQLVTYSYGLRQPYYDFFDGPGNEFCSESYMLPINLPAGESRALYTLYSTAGDPETAAAMVAAVDKSPENLEKLYLEGRKRACIPAGTEAGKKYEFSQQLMAATSLTNINFPISTRGNNIRHHVPDKFYNSLYSWDSGFIGLGFLELDKIRAIENLNVYVTDPGAQNSFVFYGTPMPVQIYLYAEIWNRYQDKEMLEFFYPRLLQFYKFIAGHVPSSLYRARKSNLLSCWDYNYNSGGWDDYPPQWHIHNVRNTTGELLDNLPAVTTAHTIRFAKILLQAAAELGISGDTEMLQADIEAFSEALQKYSWSEKDEIFSYVEHDKDGNVIGHWLDPQSKTNYNFGMDGTSPLVSGICTKDQRNKLFDRMSDPDRMWTPIGISTVDKSAAYFRTDGYWNGCVWMPHQWFYWKAALDDNRTDFAWQIAETALKVWKNEVDQSRYCFEHFSMSSHRGAGCCHFAGLSSPVLNWYGAYFVPQRFTAGYDCWIKKQTTSAESATAELVISGNSGDCCTLLYVAGEGDWSVEYNNAPVPVKSNIAGCLEITLPKASSGTLQIKRK